MRTKNPKPEPRDRVSTRKIWLYLPTPLIVAADWIGKSMAENLFGGVKTLIPGFFAIRVVRNAGGPLGFFEPARDPSFSWAPSLLAVLAVALLLWMAIRVPATKPMRHLGFACMIGGALGNLGSRAWSGYVVDFIQLWRLPIFNLADAALLAGMALAICDTARGPKSER